MSETTEKLEQLIRGRPAEIKAEWARLEAGLAALGGSGRRRGPGRPPGRRRGSGRS